MNDRAAARSKKVPAPKDEDGGEATPARESGKEALARTSETGPTRVAASATGAQRAVKTAGTDSAVKTGRIKRAKGGKTAKRQKSVPREAEQELEAITAFKRGLPLGVKLGAAVIAVIMLFTGLLGYLTYTIASRELSDQIMEQGVTAATTLEKAVDRSLWLVPPEKIIKGPGNTERYVDTVPREQLVTEWQQRLKKLVEDSPTIVHAGLIEIDPQNPNKQSATVQSSAEGIAVTGVSLVREDMDADNKVTMRIQEARLGDERVRRFDRRIDLHNARDKQITDLVHEAARLDAKPQPTPQDETDLAAALQKLQELTGLKELTSADEWVKWRDENPPPEPSQEWRDAGGNPPWVSLFVRAKRLDDMRADLWKRIAAVTGCGALAAILFTVVITALLTGPMREIEQDVAEVARGNFEHQTRVRSKDEIGALAHVFNVMVRNLRIAQNNMAERKSFERELGIAKEIQEKLLPERIPQIPGYDIHNYYRAAKEVGGDYYDFIVIDQTHLGIIVADVAGKGIPGAMVMTMARSLVRLASVRNVSPADTFKKVNRILAKDIRRGMFVTAAYMVLNVKTRVLKIASAGHNPVVLWRASKGEHELIKPPGIALGFDKGTVFDNHVKELEVQLEPGDRVVTYTDGVNEAMNDASEEFGDDRFHDLIKAHGTKTSQEFVQALVQALDRHRGGAEQSDDITIVTLAVLAGAGGASVTATDGGDAADA